MNQYRAHVVLALVAALLSPVLVAGAPAESIPSPIPTAPLPSVSGLAHRVDDAVPRLEVLQPTEGATLGTVPSLVRLHVELPPNPSPSARSLLRYEKAQVIVDGTHASITPPPCAEWELVWDLWVTPTPRREQWLYAQLTERSDVPHLLIATSAFGWTPIPFTVADTLPDDRVARAATPLGFLCLQATVSVGAIDGRIVPSPAARPFDAASERVVIALGDDVTVIEAGALACDDAGACEWTSVDDPLVRALHLAPQADGSIAFRVEPRSPVPSLTFGLRLGDDWGAVRLADGARDLPLDALDPGRSVPRFIGAEGGVLETTSANGVTYRLTIPDGALAHETLVTLAPLARTEGVTVLPAGLRLAGPARLEAHGAAGDALFAATSPLTRLPLMHPGDGPATTGLALAFGTFVPAFADPAFTDARAWVAAVGVGTVGAAADELTTFSTESLSYPELVELAAIYETQARLGCTTACVTLTDIVDRVQALMDRELAACARTASAPTDVDLQRIFTLDMIGQSVGLDTTPLVPCQHAVLKALINRDLHRALVDPSDARLALLLSRYVQVQQLGADFADLQRLPLEHLARGIRALVASADYWCAAEPRAGEAVLERAEEWRSRLHALDPTVDPGLEAFIAGELANCPRPFGMMVRTRYYLTVGEREHVGATTPNGKVTISGPTANASARLDVTRTGNTVTVGGVVSAWNWKEEQGCGLCEDHDGEDANAKIEVTVLVFAREGASANYGPGSWENRTYGGWWASSFGSVWHWPGGRCEAWRHCPMEPATFTIQPETPTRFSFEARAHASAIGYYAAHGHGSGRGTLGALTVTRG